MVGLIWFVQIVHYPLFGYVGSKEFGTFHENHKILITPVVGIVMIVELVTTGILVFQIPMGIPNWTAIVGLILLGLIWFSTLFLQIPYHNKLSSKFDDNVLMMLLNTNWIRTICWSLRGIMVLIMLDMLMKTNNL
ncbi:hypothetical protein N9357_01575 [bacterium]|jgi:hypothetical protein|nr:hypothetical protein [Paracoccaceae bacterium]MBT6894042.1 hypothetical protein [Rhodobacterales bacterium]MDB3917135.1 hypothetical protein [bacterium]